MTAPRFNDNPSGNGGHYGVQDITLAAVLGALGFPMRGVQPIAIAVNSHKLLAHVDNETGRIEDVVKCAYTFDYLTHHETFGKISAVTIHGIFDDRRLREDEKKGLVINFKQRAATDMLLKNASKKLIKHVNDIIDGIENIFMLAQHVEALAPMPFLYFAKELKKGRLSTIRPLEVEPQTQRILEREQNRLYQK